MSEENKHMGEFEASMQEAFDGFSENADAFVWDNIELELAEKKKKRAVVWWFSGVAASLALLVAVSVFNPFGETPITPAATDSTQPAATENQAEELTAPINTESAEQKEEWVSSEPSSANKDANEAAQEAASSASGNVPSPKPQQVIQGQPPTMAETKVASAKEKAGTADGLSNEGSEPTVAVAAEGISRRDLARISLLGFESAAVENEDLAQRDPSVFSPKISDGKKPKKPKEADWIEVEEGESEVSSFALLAHFSSSSGGTPNANSAASQFNSDQESIYAFSYDNAQQSRRQNYVPQKFAAPITIGAKANITLSKRLSMETGWLYSLLGASSVETDTNETSYYYTEHAHFIGIPVLLQYRFIQQKKFAFYSSQGAIVDMGIARNLRLRMVDAQGSEQNERLNLERPGFQGGLYFALGCNYALSKSASFYVEPSITAWGLNYKVSPNVRNVQLIWPSLSLGIRFDL